MRIISLRTKVFLGALSLTFVQIVCADTCSGVNVVKAEKLLDIIEAKDGSLVKLVNNQGVQVWLEPEGYPANGAHSNCFGLWTVAPDGKSGSGSGHCYRIDKEGDTFTVAWAREPGEAEGTWERVSGTGKYEGTTATGTFVAGSRFATGYGTTNWEGKCDSAN